MAVIMVETQGQLPFAGNAKRERWMIWVLCGLASVHVFIFSSAFPFFNSVDEHLHFDLAIKYSHLHFPRTLEPISDESLRYIIIFGSLEFRYADGYKTPPPWTLPSSVTTPLLLLRAKHWKITNSEASSPPLYYLLAGGWWRLCSACGFHDGFLLYLLRFLNAVFAGALIWICWYVASSVFPENVFIRRGVPALVAFMPQTAFYSISNDVLSPLCCGGVFICLLQWMQTEKPGALLGAMTGLAFAASFLTKMSNLPFLLVVVTALGVKTFKLWQKQKNSQVISAWVAFAVCAFPLIFSWAAWCQTHFGDLTGSQIKAESLGWTVKPVGEWFHHPIFQPAGFWTYFSHNIETFWQGEIWWYGKSPSLPAVNLFYVFISIFGIAAAIVCLFRSKDIPATQRRILWFAFATIMAEFVFYGFLSTIYDFHDCFYPSREYPFFTSGRLMLGALVPFLLLLTFGLDYALHRLSRMAKFSTLALLILMMVSAEVATDWPVFSSEYNWYHM